MEELIKNFRAMFRLEFRNNERFSDQSIKFSAIADPDRVLKNAREMGMNEDLIEFYAATNGFKASWDYDREQNLLGRMKILEIESVLESWEEYFYAEGADPRLKNFRPLDNFTEDAYCGIVLDGTGDQCVYYYDFSDDKLLPLDIDFKAYFDLATDARVMLYWQTYLVNLITPQNYDIPFPEQMKELFPDFDLDAFTAKFESLRLSKRIN